MYPTLKDLKEKTNEFFRLHWHQETMGNPPEWRGVLSHFQGSVPYHDMGGCYALLESEEVVYIGLGVRDDQRLGGHGLSKRLLDHVIRPIGSGRHEPMKRWESITEIYTIGFEDEVKYIAPSLEHFLIGRLSPRENKHGDDS